MVAFDRLGRPYALITETKRGTKVQTDGGFTCLPANAIRVVEADANGLYISCQEGKHYLDGQHKGDHLIGLYPA